MRMNSKLMMGALAAAALLAATPALAHGGRGHGHGHWKHDRHWGGYPAHERVVVREYVRPVPVYPRVVYPAYPVYAAPGIHVVLPDLYIPLR